MRIKTSGNSTLIALVRLWKCLWISKFVKGMLPFSEFDVKNIR